MNADLSKLFKKSSSVSFIDGERDSGKTNFSLLLLEEGQNAGFFEKLASNIDTRNDPRVKYICYFDRLEEWLKLDGKKAFILDELGVSMDRMHFMSKINYLIVKTCQLIRKYDAHLIGIAPEKEYVDKRLFKSKVFDCHITKVSRKKAIIRNHVTRRSYTLRKIPSTTIPFDTKGIAILEEHDPNPDPQKIAEIPFEEKVSIAYGHFHTTRATGQFLGVSHQTIATILRKRWDESKLYALSSVK